MPIFYSLYIIYNAYTYICTHSFINTYMYNYACRHAHITRARAFLCIHKHVALHINVAHEYYAHKRALGHLHSHKNACASKQNNLCACICWHKHTMRFKQKRQGAYRAALRPKTKLQVRIAQREPTPSQLQPHPMVIRRFGLLQRYPLGLSLLCILLSSEMRVVYLHV